MTRTNPHRVGRFRAGGGGSYHKRWVLRRLRGEPGPFIDAAPVREHLARLHGWGLAYESIARAAGVSTSVVCAITTGAHPGCRQETARAVLAVTHRPHPAQQRVLAVGARRRIHALVAIGHPLRTLAPPLRLSAGRLGHMLEQSCLPYRHWAAITELFARLCTVPGPSQQSRKVACRKGWAPPLAWDDDQIDHPDAVPDAVGPRSRAFVDQVAVERALEGDRDVDLTWTERRAAYRTAVERGMTARQVADAFGVDSATADRGLVRARARRRAAVDMPQAS